jgi:hypothetical protein
MPVRAQLKAMTMTALKQELSARGLVCEGCTEKLEFVDMLEENWDAPKVEAAPSKPKGGKAAKDVSDDDASPGGGMDDAKLQEMMAKFRGMGMNMEMLNPKMFQPGGKYGNGAMPGDSAKPTKPKKRRVEADETVEAKDEL